MAPRATYTLLDANGKPYASSIAGTVGGHRRRRIYGRLDCPSALRAIARGGYVAHRVFFADEGTARAAGYRPCAACLPRLYQQWKHTPAPSATPGKELRMPGSHSPLAHTPAQSPAGPPHPLTGAEVAAVLGILDRLYPRPEAIVLGCSRDAGSRANAATLAAAWTGRDGAVLDVVDWPEQAASWLRQARRFTATGPDAWVVTGRLPGWVQMGRRLAHSTDWSPSRTVATASLAADELITVGGVGTFDGLRGAARDGGTWEVVSTLLIHRAPDQRGIVTDGGDDR